MARIRTISLDRRRFHSQPSIEKAAATAQNLDQGRSVTYTVSAHASSPKVSRREDFIRESDGVADFSTPSQPAMAEISPPEPFIFQADALATIAVPKLPLTVKISAPTNPICQADALATIAVPRAVTRKIAGPETFNSQNDTLAEIANSLRSAPQISSAEFPDARNSGVVIAEIFIGDVALGDVCIPIEPMHENSHSTNTPTDISPVERSASETIRTLPIENDAVVIEPVLEISRTENTLSEVSTSENFTSQPDAIEDVASVTTPASEILPVEDACPEMSYANDFPRREEESTPKSPADVALDLVLNEIVLQARLSTTATTGLIALVRSGELICRATTGATAPDVATCLRVRSGIAADCFLSGLMRRADDISADTQPDFVAYRRSGVRAILVIPVKGENERRLGVLQIFSPRANAFCDRDVITLEALARRVALNVEMVEKNCSTPASRLQASDEGRDHTSKAESVRKTQASRPETSRRSLVRKGSLNWVGAFEKVAFALVTFVVVCGVIRIYQIQKNRRHTQGVAQSAPAIVAQPPVAAATSEVRSSDTLPTSNSAERAAGEALRRPTARPAKDFPSAVMASSSITVERKPIQRPVSKRTQGNKSADSASSLSRPHALLQASAQDQAAQLPATTSAEPGKENAGMAVISNQAAMARLTQRIEPEYPNAARQQRIQGLVQLDVVVNTDGAVEGLSMVSGESQLMIAAAEAVRQWRFQPLIKNGKAQKFESRIAIDFTLVSDATTSSH